VDSFWPSVMLPNKALQPTPDPLRGSGSLRAPARLSLVVRRNWAHVVLFADRRRVPELDVCKRYRNAHSER
jgi:hypothetical protein